MKKLLSIMIVAIMALSLIACGGPEPQTATLKYEENGVVLEYTIDAADDEVEKITQVSTLDCSIYSEDELTLLEETLDEYAKIYEEYEAVTYSSEISDSNMIETIVIDVTNLDQMKELAEAGLVPLDDPDASFISFDKTIESLQSQGWTLVE